VVGGVNTEDFGRMATLYFQAGSMTFRELIEARLILEPVMARMAAQRRDPELLKQLLEAGAHRKAAPGDDDVYLYSSRDFHRIVAEMAGNSILYLFGYSLHTIFQDRVRGLLFPVSRRGEVFSAHAAIAQAIADGDADRAEKLMREHMEQYARYAKRRHPALWDEVVDWR
jgi:GntR family transcriptional regulator, transcriptional repressor for pyruvate dehydrogenase complex